MTHTTEQERALPSLRHLYQQMAGGMVKDSAQAKRIAEGLLSPAIAKLEQAARRAQVVPNGWKLVPEESTEAMARAFRADDAPYYFAMTTIRCNDFAERWRAVIAAAPQPPEEDSLMSEIRTSKTVAAPVQMPEPFAYVEHHKAGDNLWFDCPGGKYSGLYTEHQVRQLLAAHGVK